MREARLQDFGPYRIVRQLAVGGMAEIYLARQRGLEGVERTVVLKRILERHAHDAEFVTMFLDEARLLAALSHPNIAQVFDVGHVGETYYLAMEHVRGPTLGALLGAAREADRASGASEGGSAGLPRREALGIGLAIAEALHYVHERRDELGRPLDIVHRDLNPANVLVSYDGAVKLIDFGIAKAATKVYETRAGVIKGTCGYIAPEQLAGTTPVDRRADVFALGILLYEMCVGVHPYDVSDEPNLMDRILEARYRRPRQVRSDVPPELDQLIASCLSPRPQERPDDMAALIEALAARLGEQRLVPTQHALATLVRALVPDDEGPRPLKRLTGEHRRPFGADPTGTRQLPKDGLAAGRQRGLSEGDDPWSVSTVSLGSVDELTLADPGASLELDAEHPLGLPPDDAMPTVSRRDAFQPIGADDELPTTLMAMPTPVVAPPARRRAPSPDDAATWVPTGTRARRSWSWVLVPAAAVALIGAGLVVTLLVVSAFAGDGQGAASESDRADRGRDAAPVPRVVELRVVSEPEGALVHVDGRPAEGSTPLVLRLPADSTQVWLRLSKPGYLEQERGVSATIGEARFVLSALRLDGDSAAPRPN